METLGCSTPCRQPAQGRTWSAAQATSERWAEPNRPVAGNSGHTGRLRLWVGRRLEEGCRSQIGRRGQQGIERKHGPLGGVRRPDRPINPDEGEASLAPTNRIARVAPTGSNRTRRPPTGSNRTRRPTG
jgi:hypothetical protein